MGAMVLSVGTCVLPTQQATHRCCQQMHMSMPCAPSSASCCSASPQAPAAFVTPIFASHDAALVAQVFAPVGVGMVSRTGDAVAVPPALSPPSGIFNLRI